MDGHTSRVGSVNIGALATRGGMVCAGSAVGRQCVGVPPDRPGPEPRADVAVLTVLTEELRAVVEVLRRHRGFRSAPLPGGSQLYQADVRGEGVDLRVVASQALEPGPQSAAAAYRRLRDAVRPSIVLLVGVAGGIRADLAIGDVVIGDEVIYYDARRETVTAARRRGKSHPTTPALRHRVNEFFLRYGSTIALRRGVHVRVFRGPIGSGSAVVTDAGSDIVRFLRRFNEKTLAVETEAGGVGQAFYEEIGSQPGSGWLTIRGISDLADPDKGHGWHQFAADHAAAVMDRLLPMLAMPGGRPAGAAAGAAEDVGLDGLAEPA
jgi:adenosylhomocysteine nucleosidase